MLYWLGGELTPFYGPFRLLSSRLVLASIGVSLAALLTWWLLPRLFRYLPPDRGREHAVGGEASIGKPTGAGVIFMPIYLGVCLLVVPWGGSQGAVLLCALLAMVTGYLDDRSERAWGQYRKALLDLGIAFLAAISVCGFEPIEIWLPLISRAATDPETAGRVVIPLLLSPSLYLPVATVLLWISINTTNCTDGVDGLSGSLLALALLYLGLLLYGVVGHQDVARYLLVPHYREGADWGIMAFTLIGTIAGYLWFNAHPSSVLMGDAGSRALGLLLGIFVLATGNPVLIVVVAGLVLVNGGAGLVKVALLRFFNIGILRSVRLPLHDHCRKNLGWSSTQVLVRFMIVQALATPILIVLLLKVR